MITEDYVDFKLAKELKILGIDKDIIWNHYYTVTGELKECSFDFKIPEDYYCSCPTLSIIQKWLREKKNINIMISNYDGRIVGHSEISYMYIMNFIKPIKVLHCCNTMYNSYEEALSAGIDKAIKILKKNDNN